MKPVLELVDVVKAFPGVVALKDISLKIQEGEIHGLVGENGAGKSTLVKILSGIYTPSSGKTLMDGKEVKLNNPLDARNCGIEVMHQDRKLLPNLSVAENLFLNQLPVKHGFVNHSEMFKKSSELLEKVGLVNLPPDTLMGNLSVAIQQMVDLARILATNPKIVLFDEPTAALSQNDVKKFFQVIRNLNKQGVSIIYVSHYLDEVLEICQKVTVLRDGIKVGTFDSDNLTADQLVNHMTGQKRKIQEPRKNKNVGSERLVVKNFSKEGVFKNINIRVNSKEVVGIYGTVGAGKTECLRGIFGIDKVDTGKINIDGTDVPVGSVKRSLNKGMVLVPEDRKRQGLVLSSSVKNNVILGYEKLLERLGFIQQKLEREKVEYYVEKLRVKTPTINTTVQSLSGGNQQKIVLSRCMGRGSQIFLLDEPTVAIDVGARAEIYRLIRELADQGSSILVASSELTEILEICDRILVMRQGEIVAELDREEASEDNLLLHAVGGDSIEKQNII